MNKAKRGEIWEVNFHPSVGAEIQKIRPAVVLNAAGIGRLPLARVVPITEWSDLFHQYSWFVQLIPSGANGLTKVSGGDAFKSNQFLRRGWCEELET
jgi:mRNA interferase MazF